MIERTPAGERLITESEFCRSETGQKALGDIPSDNGHQLVTILNALELRDHRVDSGLNYQKAKNGEPDKDIDSTYAEIFFRKNMLILAKLTSVMAENGVDLSILMPNEASFDIIPGLWIE